MIDDEDFGTVVGGAAASSSSRTKGDGKVAAKKDKISDMAMYGLPLYEPLASKALVDVFHAAAMHAVAGSSSNPVRRNMLQPSKATSSVGKRATLPATTSGLNSSAGGTSPTTMTPDTGYSAFAHLLPPPFYIVPECISTDQWEEVASDVLNNEVFRSLCGVPKLTPYHPLDASSRGGGARGSSSMDGGPETSLYLVDGDGMVSELNMTHKRIVWFSTNPNPVVYCNGTPLYAVEPVVRTEGDAPAVRNHNNTDPPPRSQKNASSNNNKGAAGSSSFMEDPCFSGSYSKLSGPHAPMFLPRDHSTLLLPNTTQSGGSRVFAPKVTASYGTPVGGDTVSYTPLTLPTKRIV
eukprot:TRINITY_DN52961_c0_g1_i1.p1 TRINITY_DN52961_c0_g1~~TRINITY_DN52961_c0_g1_i1.p1  ORF type:complete len:350 (-),score=-11.44 TRINITY_DN52961_c0_g1_i1:68-1117(-)